MKHEVSREVGSATARVYFGPRKGRWIWPHERHLVAEHVRAGDPMDAIYLTQNSRNESWTENDGLLPVAHRRVRSSRTGDVVDFGHIAYVFSTFGPIPFNPQQWLTLNGLTGRIARYER